MLLAVCQLRRVSLPAAPPPPLTRAAPPPPAGFDVRQLSAAPAAMSERRLDLLLDRNSKLSAQCDVQRKQITQLEKR